MHRKSRGYAEFRLSFYEEYPNEKGRRKMKRKMVTKILTVLLAATLVAGLTGCQKKDEAAVVTTKTYEDGAVLGEGSTVFDLTVVNKAGEETTMEIHTDEETVGGALTELEVIAGEEGDYGLYIKSVNGEFVDFDTDGKYWAFYINGEYAMSGIDLTPITEGEEYTLKVE